MKKYIFLVAGLCISQTCLQTPPPVNEPRLQKLIDALANSDKLEQFIESTDFFKNYPPTDILNLKDVIINTHQGTTTLYNYAKQLNKKYFIELIDFLIFIHEAEHKNWQNLQEIINKSNFNPNLYIPIFMNAGKQPMIITLFAVLLETEAPLDIIQSILDKGASLTAHAGLDEQNWQVAIGVMENIEKRTKEIQEIIHRLQLEFQQATDQNEITRLKDQIENHDTLVSGIQQNNLPYAVALIEMIERTAQQRGNKEVLESIADAKEKFKIEI